MKYEIKNRWTGSVQFTAEIECEEDAPLSVKIGLSVLWGYKNGTNLYGAYLTRANLNGANLDGANLNGANLYRADLYRADLDGADLYGANLYGADLTRANLYRANLTRANLYGANLNGANLYGANLNGANLTRANLNGADLYRANLDGANLDGANLDGADLVGDRPFLQIGPIGSRQDQLRAWIRETGIYVQTGCFKGSLDDFCAAVQKSHGADEHGYEYLAAIDLIQVHAAIWGGDGERTGVILSEGRHERLPEPMGDADADVGELDPFNSRELESCSRQ